MKLLLWLKLIRESFKKRRSVSHMTFDIKQEYFTIAVEQGDMITMKKLLELAEYQKIRRLHHTKGKLYPYKP